MSARQRSGVSGVNCRVPPSSVQSSLKRSCWSQLHSLHFRLREPRLLHTCRPRGQKRQEVRVGGGSSRSECRSRGLLASPADRPFQRRSSASGCFLPFVTFFFQPRSLSSRPLMEEPETTRQKVAALSAAAATATAAGLPAV